MELGRRVGNERHPFVSHRMVEGNLAGMKRDVAVVVAPRKSIFEVALDGTTQMCQLATYLVMTTCVEHYLQQMVAAIAHSEGAVVKDGQLAVGIGFVGHKALVQSRHAVDIILEMAFLLRRGVLHNRPVAFLEIATLLNHHVQPSQSLAGFGEDHSTAHRAVQPMDDTAEDVAHLVVTHTQESTNLVRHTDIARLVALGDLATLLVEHQQVVVFVYDLVAYGHCCERLCCESVCWTGVWAIGENWLYSCLSKSGITLVPKGR